MQDTLRLLQNLVESDQGDESEPFLNESVFDFLVPSRDDVHLAWPVTNLYWQDAPEISHESVLDLAGFLEPEAASQAQSLLASDDSDDAISALLLEIFGYENIDKVSEALSNRSSYRDRTTGIVNGLNGHDIAHLGHQSQTRQPYVPQSQILFRDLEQEAQDRKARQAAHKARQRQHNNSQPSSGRQTPDLVDLQRKREEALRNAGSRDARANLRPENPDQIRYANVYSAPAANQLVSALGNRFALPEGTTRIHHEHYEEITIPTPAKIPMRSTERLIPISELDALARGSFPGYETLNRLQSIVFPTAYKSNENMLVCAPTGAGKTDVAMLTILHVLSLYGNIEQSQNKLRVTTADFKIVYVAPMKALAAEVVRKLSKRLAWLSVKARELTGDMQLSRKEIDETHIIVTTPEKWAVVTNKPGLTGSLASKVKLLIVDEVHLLHDERGAVVELLIARTLRQVESSQSLIRIVGLSATLPNYLDVADFLGVNRQTGLFYFDASFRPVPLEQHFIGVKGKAGSPTSRSNLDEACFDKVTALVKEGHQVMVFVHARKETVKTAKMLQERSMLEGEAEFYDPATHPRFDLCKREVGSSRNKELKELFQHGFGIHHAGMLRTDRNMSERFFEQGITKVLVCTATLAWGVNLPAYAVLIKGTQIYDPSKGAFVDLSILDVLQIFGRAGRPQYETHGVGFIATTADKLDHYVNAITQQHPIESKFVTGLLDALNSEIALGTIRTIDEGVRWIGYTFLFVRMRKNPMVYGLTAQDVETDPSLGQERHKLMVMTASTLARFNMVEFDKRTGSLKATEYGIVASKYFLRAFTVEMVEGELKQQMTEADILAVISKSKEFEQVAVREEEGTELQSLMEKIPCQVKGGISTNYGKVNILLQAYISRFPLDDFALISDQAYVVQNAGRIARALFEFALNKHWSRTAASVLGLCKAIEKQMWPFDNPLKQCSLAAETKLRLVQYAEDYTTEEILIMDVMKVAELLNTNEKHAQAVLDAAALIPKFTMEVKIQSLTTELVRVTINVKKAFNHTVAVHGPNFHLWLWVASAGDSDLLAWAHVILHHSQSQLTQQFDVEWPAQESFVLHLESDSWFTNTHTVEKEFHIASPDQPLPWTILQQLPLLKEAVTIQAAAVSCTVRPEVVLHPLLSQVMHSILWSRGNMLMLTSDSEVLRQAAVYTLLALTRTKSNTLVIAKDASTLHALCRAYKKRGSATCHIPSPKVPFPSSPPQITFETVDIVWEYLTHSDYFSKKKQPPFANLICLDVQGLDADYELLVTKLRSSMDRVVTFGFPVHDMRGLQYWLDCSNLHSYNFEPATRSTPLQISIKTYSIGTASALPQILPTMFESLHAVDYTAESLICVLPSRFQLREVASALIRHSQSSADVGDSSPFSLQPLMLEATAASLDLTQELEDFVQRGVLLLSEITPAETRKLLLQCYAAKAANLIVISQTMLYRLPELRATYVFLLGCNKHLFTAEGAQIQAAYSEGDVIRLSQYATKQFFLHCTELQRDSYSRLFHQGVILESKLADSSALATFVLKLLAERPRQLDQLLERMQDTYLVHRMKMNSGYYVERGNSLLNDMSRLLDEILAALKVACLIRIGSSQISLSEIGSAFLQSNLQLEAVNKIQSMKAIPNSSNTPLSSFAEQLRKYVSPSCYNLEKHNNNPVSQYNRFPRHVKQRVPLEKEDPHVDWQKVLWLGFVEGRMPPTGPLEIAMAELVRSALNREQAL